MGISNVYIPHFKDVSHVTFKTDDNNKITLSVNLETARKMEKGQRGLLSYKYDFFIDFKVKK